MNKTETQQEGLGRGGEGKGETTNISPSSRSLPFNQL